jgi:hypothetical protein
MDKLEKMWQDQEKFMRLLQEKRNFADFPVDVSSKCGQKLIKEMANEGIHEFVEAVQLLKNSKAHRAANITQFDLDDFVEECVDVQKYLYEVLLLAGVSVEQFFEVFEKKTMKNIRRINEGY